MRTAEGRKSDERFDSEYTLSHSAVKFSGLTAKLTDIPSCVLRPSSLNTPRIPASIPMPPKSKPPPVEAPSDNPGSTDPSTRDTRQSRAEARERNRAEAARVDLEDAERILGEKVVSICRTTHLPCLLAAGPRLSKSKAGERVRGELQMLVYDLQLRDVSTQGGLEDQNENAPYLPVRPRPPSQRPQF